MAKPEFSNGQELTKKLQAAGFSTATFVASVDPEVEDDSIEIGHGVHVQVPVDGRPGVVSEINEAFRFYPERITMTMLIADIKSALAAAKLMETAVATKPVTTQINAALKKAGLDQRLVRNFGHGYYYVTGVAVSSGLYVYRLNPNEHDLTMAREHVNEVLAAEGIDTRI